jgi:hypothetical protein
MKKFGIVTALLVSLTAPTVVRAERIQAKLTGYEEVPAVSTVASGEFRGQINRDDQSIDYKLTYKGLQGTVTQAHIHVGQLSVIGSIVIWLCQTVTNADPTGLSPECPAGQDTEAVVTRTITSANVIDASTASQQLTAGEIDEVIAGIRAGAAYVNVHTSPLSPGGEIRGQIRASKR